MDPDADLSAAQRGDSSAFGRLIAGHAAEGFRIAAAYTRDDDVAWDMWQDALVSAWKRLPEFHGNAANFRAWLMTILSNRCLDQVRYDQRHRPVEPASGSAFTGTVDQPTEALHLVLDGSRSVEQLLEDEDFEELLYSAIAAVPEPYRAVLALYVSDHAYHEIAEILATPTNTVGSRLSRGRKAAQEFLAGVAELPAGRGSSLRSGTGR